MPSPRAGSRAARILVAAPLLMACGGAGERSPAAPSSIAPVAPADEQVEAAAAPAAVEPSPPELAPGRDPAALIGWWRGDDVCIELFENGDFELSKLGRGPKVMAMGAATVTAAGDGFELQLATARIWKARFTGPCRKVHELGGWADAEDLLGVDFKPGLTSTLTIKRTGDAQVELCGQRCATLSRQTPHLGARWRRAELTAPARPEKPWRAGDLLELDLGASSSHLWLGFAANKLGVVYGRSEVSYASPDRFTVTFEPEHFADVPDGAAATALDLRFTVGQRQALHVRRLAGERIEVCALAGQCATLERQFDAYHHDLD